MKLIVDERIRNKELDVLKQFGEVILIKRQSIVYEQISAHPDIFISTINDKLICAPIIYDYLKENNISSIKGEKDPRQKYPGDVLYNVCQIGKYVIGNLNYCDKVVLDEINKENLIMINVKQGYSNCSICKVYDNACITSDEGIYNELIKNNIDSLLIKQNTIKLLDDKGNYSNMNGFIGGACSVIDDKFIIFGDISLLGGGEAERVKIFIKKYNLKLIDFPGEEIIDYGGIVLT